ncbi:MAG: hypothetical protein LBR81_10120 [Prevotellaceae bacterium]|jgi:hypothetical protein|nr:hypothetical protein [Prevotellaceae bacterium]
MEIFKNRNDKAYIRIIAILTAMAAAASIIGIIMASTNNTNNVLIATEILLTTFTMIGIAIFSFLYPFHLLNVDYKNKVISLIFAGGVSRKQYYFVKIGATILSCLIAFFIILFIPIMIWLVAYPAEFTELIRNIFRNFKPEDISSFMLASILGLIANIVMLTTAVIISKGKITGIFLYLAFSFIVSIVQGFFMPDNISLFMINNTDMEISQYFYQTAIFAVFQIIAFTFIGLRVLDKQDL